VAKALDITIFPIKDSSGRITNAVIQHNDITEEEKAKEEVSEKVDELEKLGKFSVGRELKMVELKNRIRELEQKLAEKEGK
jgi:small-conductance mechanosensitive channel